jgi:SulP family sulfate permease
MGKRKIMRSSLKSFLKEFLPASFSCLQHHYTKSLFKHDLIAGVTVGLVALPLAMAFSIAAGLTPQQGLITAIVAGFLISLLGGSRFQIGGPTGAFVVIIYDIIERTGYEGLVLVTLMASVILLISAFTRIGSLIKYIPYPLITGFTTGIALLIFSSQIKDFLGLHIPHMPANFLSMWSTIFHFLPSFNPATLGVGCGTLALILLIRRFLPILPWGITSVAIATLLVKILHLPVETIADRFGQITLSLSFPNFKGMAFSLENWHLLIPDAITVAFLAGIESLLSAIVADGMTGSNHKTNCELMAQGIANMGAILVGGIPATGAIARTATNIKTGAKTPLAGMIHAITLLLIVLFLAPLVSQMPLASLSAMLIMISWNMSEMHRFKHLFKAPKRDITVLLATFLLTVLVDLTAAVEIGMILSVFLFMQRVKESTGITSLVALEASKTLKEEEYHFPSIEKKDLPHGLELYEITGPFFFGIADSLKNILSQITFKPKVFILRMRKVPLIDASGMHALEEFYDQCKREHTLLLLSGVQPFVFKKLKKFGIIHLIGEQHVFAHTQEALAYASKLLEKKDS